MAWSIADLFRRKSDDTVGSELADRFREFEFSQSGISVNSGTAMQHVAVMACVSLLSEDVAKIPLGVFDRLPNGGKVANTKHPLARLLRNPNAWQTAFEFKEMLQAALVLRGNAYAVTIRDGHGRPLALVPIHPDRVTLYEAPGGDWFYMVTRNGLHEMAVLKDQPILVPAEDVLHIRWLSQWNSLLGSSRIQMIRESVGAAIGLEQHQNRFIGQGARLGGILSTEQKLSKEVRDQLVAEWSRVKSGPRNSGATAVLEQGLSWTPLGLTMVDSQFIETRGFQLRDIARAFGVPAYKLGVEGESSGPSMVQQGQEYLNGPISGYCERWKSKLEKFFDLDGIDTFVDWDYSHFLKADIQTRYTAYRQAVGGPWMSVDEARLSEGMSSVEHGDKVLQAANMVPLGTPPPEKGTGSPGSDSTGVPGQGGDGDAERIDSK